jgi:hypothetical protein
VKNSPNGKQYCQNVVGQFSELGKNKGSLELDVKKDPKLNEQSKLAAGITNLQYNFNQQKNLAGQMIQGLKKIKIPPEVAKIAKIYYEEAKKFGLNDEDGGEEFATTQAGGFLMLRLVNPVITTTLVSGPLPEDEELRRVAEQPRRLALLQTKIYQIMANGATIGQDSTSELLRDILFVKDTEDFTTETLELRNFLKQVATEDN